MAIPRELAFEPAEYQARLHAIQERMRARELDAVLLFGPQNIYYVSGLDNDNLSDIQCVVVPRDRDPILVLFFFEAGRAENSSWLKDVVLYGMDDDPIGAVAGVVQKLGLHRGRLAVEQPVVGLTTQAHGRLVAALPDATIEDAFGIVEIPRRRKSAAELAYMRRAADLTDRAVDAACSALTVGMRDTDIAATIVDTIYRGGGETACFGPIVAVGYRAGAPHSSINGTRVKRGETIFLEFTAQVHRYTAPIMRTALLGRPSPEIERVAQAGAAAVEAILDHAKPGVAAGAVARAALAELEPVLGGLMFHHTFGYPVGIGFPVTWVEGLGFLIRAENSTALETGMTFHLPISLRKFGEFGVNQSRTIVITETGAEPLTRSTARLLVKDDA